MKHSATGTKREFRPPDQLPAIPPQPNPGEDLVRHDDGVDEFPRFQVQGSSEMERVQGPQSTSRAVRINEFFGHFVVTHPEGKHKKPAYPDILTKPLENQRRIGR